MQSRSSGGLHFIQTPPHSRQTATFSGQLGQRPGVSAAACRAARRDGGSEAGRGQTPGPRKGAEGQGRQVRGPGTCSPLGPNSGTPQRPWRRAAGDHAPRPPVSLPADPHLLKHIFRVIHGERIQASSSPSALSGWEPLPSRISRAASVAATTVCKAPGHWPGCVNELANRLGRCLRPRSRFPAWCAGSSSHFRQPS